MSLLNQNLQAFVAIVRHGTVHGAAGDLHITQTGVTQRIRSIEKELGVSLFLRSRKGMNLTQEGEVLLRYCRGAEELQGQALSQLVAFGKDKPVFLTITGPTSVMTARISKYCQPLYSQWPNLYLNLAITDEVDRLRFVRSGKADLAIVPTEQVPKEMDSKLLKPDKFILVGSPKWKGRKLADILSDEKIIDFHENDMTTISYLRKFNLISNVKRPRLFANNNEVILRMFSDGIGFGALTQEVAAAYLNQGKLIVLNGGAAMEEGLALVWYPRTEAPLYLKALIRAIK